VRSPRNRIIFATFGALALTATQAQAVNPYLPPDQSWITLTGTVTSAGDEELHLDFGSGVITVEMDDWYWEELEPEQLEGDVVRVSGRIDDDLFEGREIQADSIYVDAMKTYFYPDIDFTHRGPLYTALSDGSQMTVTGVVQDIDDEEFVVAVGTKTVRVNTDELGYNPLDDEGIQQIDEGDVVAVSGEVDVDFFENAELSARAIATISPGTDS
jgi:uncharacterized protein YdeI (BOF family)